MCGNSGLTEEFVVKRRFAQSLSIKIMVPVVVACLSAPVAAAQSAPAAAPPSQDARLTWFREAKFGLFIHWGLYAIPAGEWKGQPVAGIGEWIMNRAQIPVFDATPFHRDPLKELSAACARHGIKFGFYYSQAQDWHEPNGAGNTWDFGPDDKKDFDQYLRGKAEPQVKELLTGYGPVCLIWFDTPRMMNVGDRAQRFIDILHTLQPATLIDGRLGTAGDYVSMGDNRIPDAVVKGDWEVPATLNHTWGFKKDDTDWKTPEDLTFKLVDIVSKGGNYLLNVGPTSEGIIPQASQDNLRAVGRWLKVNGEAVYGAGPTPFGDELGAIDDSTHDKKGNPGFKIARDWRCTTKPGKLYIHVFKWPAGSLELTKVKGKVTKACFLADARHTSLKVNQKGDAVTVSLPGKAPGEIASVMVLETQTK